LSNIPMEKHADAVTTFCYKAHMRASSTLSTVASLTSSVTFFYEVHACLLDPVYGCLSDIFGL
jgi:hypothetical protein